MAALGGMAEAVPFHNPLRNQFWIRNALHSVLRELRPMPRPLTTLLLMTAVALALLVASCGQEHTSMRYAQTSPTSPNVDVLINGKIIITNMAYLASSSYLTILGGTREMEVRSTGTKPDLIDSNIGFDVHKNYTVLQTGKVPTVDYAVIVIVDDLRAPAPGDAKIRVIHNSPSAPNTHLDVYIVAPGTDITNLTPTVAVLAYQQASFYQNVDPSLSEVIFTDPNDPGKTRLIDYTFPSLAAGQIRTVIAVDVAGGTAISGTPLVLPDVN
jgi:hypothetical protein